MSPVARAVAAAVATLAVGCGRANDGVTLAGDVEAPVQGKVVQTFWEHGSTPHERVEWLLVDTTDGTVMDGSTRLALQIVPGQLWCGAADTQAQLEQFKAGDLVTFALLDPAQRPSPLPPRPDGSAVPAFGARDVRMPCPATPDEVRDALAEHRERWEAAGIDSYDATISWRVFNPCGGDYRVSVVGGRAMVVEPTDGRTTDLAGRPMEQCAAEVPSTVERVFDVIDRSASGDDVEVTYDPTYGYPLEVEIDVTTQGMDDEVGISIRDLQPAAGAPPTG